MRSFCASGRAGRRTQGLRVPPAALWEAASWRTPSGPASCSGRATAGWGRARAASSGSCRRPHRRDSASGQLWTRTGCAAARPRGPPTAGSWSVPEPPRTTAPRPGARAMTRRLPVCGGAALSPSAATSRTCWVCVDCACWATARWELIAWLWRRRRLWPSGTRSSAHWSLDLQSGLLACVLVLHHPIGLADRRRHVLTIWGLRCSLCRWLRRQWWSAFCSRCGRASCTASPLASTRGAFRPEQFRRGRAAGGPSRCRALRGRSWPRRFDASACRWSWAWSSSTGPVSPPTWLLREAAYSCCGEASCARSWRRCMPGATLRPTECAQPARILTASSHNCRASRASWDWECGSGFWFRQGVTPGFWSRTTGCGRRCCGRKTAADCTQSQSPARLYFKLAFSNRDSNLTGISSSGGKHRWYFFLIWMSNSFLIDTLFIYLFLWITYLCCFVK